MQANTKGQLGDEIRAKGDIQMKKINLLPKEAQRAKDVRRVTIIIAAVLAVIFLAVVLLYVFFSMWETRLNREIQSLNHLLSESPTQQAVRETPRFFLQEEFLIADALFAAQEVPRGISLHTIRFSHGEFSITAHATDILNIQAHMEALNEYFYDIRLLSLTATDDGYYVYELVFLAR